MKAAALRPAAVALTLLACSIASRADEPRDPMRPPLREGPAPASAAHEELPVVSAVLNFEGRRTAIFNGRLVHEGSVVGAYTIDSVLEDGVRYTSAHLTREIHLPHPESPIKKPAAEPARPPSGESP